MDNEKKPKTTKKQKAKIAAAATLLFLSNMLIFLMFWIMDKYDKVEFDQIFYQLITPMEGTSSTIVWSAILRVVGLGSLAFGIELLLYFLLSGKFRDKLSRLAWYVKYSASKTAAFFKKHFMPLSALMLVICFTIPVLCLGVHTFVGNQIIGTSFIEDNYADPDEKTLTFPEQKRNLIYIFVESMESTFRDTAAGGSITHDLIPELSELADKNISFAGDNGISGAYTYTGTAWTASALVAQTAGVIIKIPFFGYDAYGKNGNYMPGITALGDILEDAGYNQSLIFGSVAKFAARDLYFTEHGNYKIIDLNSLIADGTLPEGYREWWGFEDIKLFEESKKEIERLYAIGEPFNFTTLTADTHFPDGYLCEKCPGDSDNQYTNVLSCQSKQIYEFIEWCKAQPFYENTTIILSGDHLTMDPEFLAEIDKNYVRTTYNCIINAPVQPVHENGREFATFDMFPTTLAALGVEIEGNRLGLGTNLFSEEETLTEIYGRDVLEAKLLKKSNFYFEKFFKKEQE